MIPRSITLAMVLLLGCRDRRPTSAIAAPASPDIHVDTWSDRWLLEEANRYLDDPAHRRRSLEASLTQHDNSYSRQRLDHYALGATGWDLP